MKSSSTPSAQVRICDDDQDRPQRLESQRTHVESIIHTHMHTHTYIQSSHPRLDAFLYREGKVVERMER